MDAYILSTVSFGCGKSQKMYWKLMEALLKCNNLLDVYSLTHGNTLSFSLQSNTLSSKLLATKTEGKTFSKAMKQLIKPVDNIHFDSIYVCRLNIHSEVRPLPRNLAAFYAKSTCKSAQQNCWTVQMSTESVLTLARAAFITMPTMNPLQAMTRQHKASGRR